MTEHDAAHVLSHAVGTEPTNTLYHRNSHTTYLILVSERILFCARLTYHNESWLSFIECIANPSPIAIEMRAHHISQSVGALTSTNHATVLYWRLAVHRARQFSRPWL